MKTHLLFLLFFFSFFSLSFGQEVTVFGSRQAAPETQRAQNEVQQKMDDLNTALTKQGQRVRIVYIYIEKDSAAPAPIQTQKSENQIVTQQSAAAQERPKVPYRTPLERTPQNKKAMPFRVENTRWRSEKKDIVVHIFEDKMVIIKTEKGRTEKEMFSWRGMEKGLQYFDDNGKYKSYFYLYRKGELRNFDSIHNGTDGHFRKTGTADEKFLKEFGSKG